MASELPSMGIPKDFSEKSLFYSTSLALGPRSRAPMGPRRGARLEADRHRTSLWLAALSARLRASASASLEAFWLEFLDFGLDFDLDSDLDSDLI